jgi:hypothetical protein
MGSQVSDVIFYKILVFYFIFLVDDAHFFYSTNDFF